MWLFLERAHQLKSQILTSYYKDVHHNTSFFLHSSGFQLQSASEVKCFGESFHFDGEWIENTNCKICLLYRTMFNVSSCSPTQIHETQSSHSLVSRNIFENCHTLIEIVSLVWLLLWNNLIKLCDMNAQSLPPTPISSFSWLLFPHSAGYSNEPRQILLSASPHAK